MTVNDKVIEVTNCQDATASTMLNIKKIGGGTHGGEVSRMAHYYDEAKPDVDRTPDEYRLDSAAPSKGEWWSPGGKLARDGDAVTQDALRKAFAGKSEDGRKLVQKAKRNTRIAGDDLAWSAPKSVSVVYAISDDATRQGIMADMVASVRIGLNALHATDNILTRRGRNGVSRETAADVQVALFVHATSRAGDPQLHVHAVLANLAVRHDGTTGTLQTRPIYEHKAQAGAVFLEALAQRMEARGLAVERLDTREKLDAGFRIQGVPPELEKLWSKRSATIQERAAATPGIAASGPRRHRQLAKITRATRRLKSSLPSFGDLQQRWRDELHSIGMTIQGVWDRIKDAASRVRDRLQPKEKEFTMATGPEPNAEERLLRVYASKVNRGEMAFTEAVSKMAALTQPKPTGIDPVHKTPIYEAGTPGPVTRQGQMEARVLEAIDKVDRGTAWDDVLKPSRDAAAKSRTIERDR